MSLYSPNIILFKINNVIHIYDGCWQFRYLGIAASPHAAIGAGVTLGRSFYCLRNCKVGPNR